MNLLSHAVPLIFLSCLTPQMSQAQSGESPGTPATIARASAPAGPAKQQSAAPPFRAIVDMGTFMDHVLTPAAMVVWRTNGFVNNGSGEHDLSPKTEADWELVVSGAATLAEATNALLIPQRSRDAAWNGYVAQLAALAEQAYQAAEKHDLKTVSAVSDRLDAACSACHSHYGLE